MTHYLPTCGGWQRDATYRFTSTNWNVPQYVYMYAHNDADGPPGAGHVGAVVTPIAAIDTNVVTAGSGQVTSASGVITTAGSGSFGFDGSNLLITGLGAGDTILIAGGSCAAAGSYTVTSVVSNTVNVAETVATETTPGNCKMSRPAYPGNNLGAGGSETVDTGYTFYDTAIKHYVETEDTMDNMMRATGFVQRSKHGGIYTWGNIERFPFGRPVDSDDQNSHDNLHETGFTTYGYSSYESLYGYVQPDAHDNSAPEYPADDYDGYKCNGRTEMGFHYEAVAAVALASSIAIASSGNVANELKFDFGANNAPAVAFGDIIEVTGASCHATLKGTYTVATRGTQYITVVEPADKLLQDELGGSPGTTLGTDCSVGRTHADFRSMSGVDSGIGSYAAMHSQTAVAAAAATVMNNAGGAGIGAAGAGTAYFGFAATNDVYTGAVLGTTILVEEQAATCTLASQTFTVTAKDDTGFKLYVAETVISFTAANCKVSIPADVPVVKDPTEFIFSGASPNQGGGRICYDPDDRHSKPWVDQDSYTQASYIQSNTNGQDLDVHIGGRGGDLCVPYHDAANRAAAGNTVNKPCVPRFAEDLSSSDPGVQIDHVVHGAGTALYQPPKDVTIRVTDNDVIVEQAQASVDGCRSTTLFQYAQGKEADTEGQQHAKVNDNQGVFKTQWLTDYNCKSGDAGGLPGYPVEVAGTVSSSSGIDGYCTDSAHVDQDDCVAEKYCTVAGVCHWGGGTDLYNARTEDECGECAGITSTEGTGLNRYTKAECIKDVNNDGTPDGQWTAHTNKAVSTELVWNQANPDQTTVAAIAAFALDAPGSSASAKPAGLGSFEFSGSNLLIAKPLQAGDVIMIASNSAGDCTAAGSYTVSSLSSNVVNVMEPVLAYTPAQCDMSLPANGCNDLTGYTAGSGTTTSVGVVKTHTFNTRPLGDAALSPTWANNNNEQCCSCVPAYGTTITAATLSVFTSRDTCLTGANGGDREGAAWQCDGVGPYCAKADRPDALPGLANFQ